MTVDRETGPRLAPREWAALAAELVDRDPSATAIRLGLLADRLARLEPALPVDERLELTDRLAAIERTVRLYRAAEAALLSTRPAIEAAERVLAAAGR